VAADNFSRHLHHASLEHRIETLFDSSETEDEPRSIVEATTSAGVEPAKVESAVTPAEFGEVIELGLRHAS